MKLEILCTSEFSDEENAEIDREAQKMGVSREDFLRKAVRFFVSKCVPTQGKSDPAGCAA